MIPVRVTAHAVNRLRERFPADETWEQSQDRLRSLYARSEPYGVQRGQGQLRGCDGVFLAIEIESGIAIVMTVLTEQQARTNSVNTAIKMRPLSRRSKAKRRRHARLKERLHDTECDA